MKGKKLLCMVLSLAAACSLMLIRDSAAWQNTNTGVSPSSLIVVDKMAFQFEGKLGSYLEYPEGTNQGDAYVVTEQNLIVTNGGRITVTNHSTIPTEARFKIYYDTPGHLYANNAAIEYSGSDTDSLSVDIGDNWILNTTDGYYYYQLPTPEGESAPPAGFPAVSSSDTPTPVDVITNLMYLDELYVNGTDVLNHADYFVGGTPFSGEVHVIFEAKQADLVDWTQITTWATS